MKRLVYRDNAIVEVVKDFTFDSCHHLNNYEGKCKNLHGHTYKLQVGVKSSLNEIGMVIDFNKLKEIVNNIIIDKVDHTNLNECFPFNTTAENMVVYIYDKLKSIGLSISFIRLWETPTSFAEYRGEDK